MLNKYIIRLFGIVVLSFGLFFAFTFFSSPTAQAAPDFSCVKSDASYWTGAISMPSSVPTWIKGCFQRITINQGWTGTVSFMYLSPETNDLSTGDKTATLNAVYYYRGTAGVNYAGMCLSVTSTSNSDGRTNIMSIPDVGFGFSVPCSGWLGHDQSRLTSSTVTLYASKFNAGSNKTATFNYRMAADFSKNSTGTDKSGLYCYDFANVVPAPTVGPPNPPWKTPPCVADGSNYTFVNIIKTPPTYDGTISLAKYREGATLGQFPASPSVLNNATVGLDHSPPDSWSPTKTSNPGAFNNIWVNPSNHESNTKGNYRAFVNVPTGWKVVRATNRGSNASLNGTCTSGGKCSVYGVTVDNNGTTYVDFFFEPDIRGSFDGACPKNQSANDYKYNGKAWGWVIDYNYTQQANNASVTPSQVRVRITEKANDGSLIASTEKSYTVTANVDRPDLPGNTSNPSVGRYHGFEFNIPAEYFNGKNYDIKVFPLRSNQGIGSPPYMLGQRSMNCPPPTGRVDCPTVDGINYIRGWTFDPQKPEGPSNVHIYYDSTPGNTSDPDAVYNDGSVFGTIKLDPNEITARKNEGYRGVDANGLYRFMVPIPDGLHDGENHVVRVYMITAGDNTPNPALEFINTGGSTELTFGPSTATCNGVEKWWWPWLQTQNGDTVNKGKITGQKLAANATDLPGARLANTPTKEAEFLIISMSGGGNPFCSNYNYILTNTAATTGDCNNGAGYGTLQLYDLGPGGDDKIFKSISEAFTANGAGNPPGNTLCKPYNTEKSVPSTINTGEGSKLCEGGTIYQLQSGDDLAAKSLYSGRNTIFKDGNLKITGNIAIDESGVFRSNNPRLQPNLAIIVKGDVYIDRTVTRIDSAIYATGKIYTCSNGSAIPFEQCNTQLVVNGMLVSKNGYDFRRTFASDGRQPAELVRLKGQNIAFPPPGLDNLYFEDFNSDVRIDTSEFQPKF